MNNTFIQTIGQIHYYIINAEMAVSAILLFLLAGTAVMGIITAIKALKRKIKIYRLKKLY